MENDIMSQGLELMLYGMGTVVAFLSLLVVATLLMSAIVRRYFAEPAPAAGAGKSAPAQPASDSDAELVAVISAAIHQHRSKR